MSAFVSAVIVAAGGSVRMGTADSKQFIPLLGKPAIQYTLNAFQDCELISEIVVVCREQDIGRVRSIAADNGITKLAAVVNGGETRAQSVKNGADAVSPSSQYLAIHDGARPLVTAQEIACVVEAALESGAATLSTPVTDTIKVIDEDGFVESTPPRVFLRAVQTPQVFERELYLFAADNAADSMASVTDDCSLIELMGGEVTVVDGKPTNIKLTTPIDIVIAESILQNGIK